jgi:hypothetical protein
MAERTLINGAKYRDAPRAILERALARREFMPGGCWRYPSTRSVDGYSEISYRGAGRKIVHLTVHRLVYVHLVGDPGDDMVLDHLCHDPDVCKLKTKCPHRACCNPAHLKPCPPGENVLRSYSVSGVNAVKTHCDHGHEFTLANTYIHSDGSRNCRECKRLWAQSQRQRIGRGQVNANDRARRLAAKLTEERFCCQCGAGISHRSRRAVFCEECRPPNPSRSTKLLT